MDARHMQLARNLREKHGWSYREIGRRLGVRGQTVKRWCDEEYAETVRARVRRDHAERSRRRHVPSGEFLLARARVLNEEAGMSFAAISKLYAFDYGETAQGQQISQWVKQGRWRIPGRGRPSKGEV